MIHIKSIFWTSFFWILVIFSLFLYLRVRNQDLVVEVFGIKNYTNVDLEDKLEALTKKVDNLQNEVKTLGTKLDKNSQKLENITLKLVSESEKKLEQSGTHVEFQTGIILSGNVVTGSVVTGN